MSRGLFWIDVLGIERHAGIRCRDTLIADGELGDMVLLL